MSESELSPVQQEVIDRLGKHGDPIQFPAELKYQLRGEMENAIGPHLEALKDDTLIIRANKHSVGAIQGCEKKFLAEREWSGWTVQMARGSVAHKAIELQINWTGYVTATQLVVEAIASLEHAESNLSEFLQQITPTERAELQSGCVDIVSAYIECWPPIKREWRPVVEATTALWLFDGRVRFSGKIDLTLGHARGSNAEKVLVDFKTGNPHQSHAEDLRFYALLEAIRIGVPPRIVASYYLSAGHFNVEPITEDTLFAAAERASRSVISMIELEVGSREPSVITGPACRWCRTRDTCEAGQISLREFDDPGEDF